AFGNVLLEVPLVERYAPGLAGELHVRCTGKAFELLRWRRASAAEPVIEVLAQLGLVDAGTTGALEADAAGELLQQPLCSLFHELLKQCLVGDLFQVVEWRLEEAGLPDEENRIRARTIRIQGVKTLLGGSASAGFADQATMEMQDDASGR